MKRGTIAILNCDGNAWNGRAVLVTELGDGHHEVMLPEQQVLPLGERQCMLIHESYLTQLSPERQEQIANTMGLRLEALPYV